jgi:hypothetical protein
VRQRNNIFVIAALLSECGSAQVRIRNVSQTGALIEGPGLPSAGQQVLLRRGRISIQGVIVWRLERRAGLKFASAVSVDDWLPRAQRAPGQQFVDELVHYAKCGSDVSILPSQRASDQRAMGAADEMLRVGRMIGQIVEDLSGDPIMMERHATALLMLDTASQTLSELALKTGA